MQELLESLDVPFLYEKTKIVYTVPVSQHKYTPDFTFPDLSVIIETKGRFMPADMKKHLLIKEQHPDLDIRFVFTNPNGRNSKRTKTTYANWCNKHGFKYCSIKDVETIYRWVNEKDGSTESSEQTQEQST